ncbi:hypothetical protein [Anaeromyxobacter sp. Fw109-5]|uniref:hypothetical protein n=1 Tax=Anaeromyxobacter sp. (strain Fw109-5) TaxID=404589 RepID=UPI000158A452|nr:hypothetical protein [Anaeromyxobacter sp. Fw109-5]ABS27792.1 hypothetical protein Anae109_3611 [Anaeromyxobacter sp. Fw109-5]
MRALVVALAATALAACSSEKSKPVVVPGCDVGSGLCRSGPGMTPTVCGAEGGAFLPSGCPSASRVGGCTTPEQGQPMMTSFYSPDYSAADGAAVCAAMYGTWTSAGGGGGGGGGTVTVHCRWPDDQCWEVTGPLTATDLAEMESACGSMQGIYAATACSTANTVAGLCFYADAGWPESYEEDYYYTASWTLTTAQADCASYGGSWRTN